MSNMICYIWFERVLYTDYNPIGIVLKAVFASCSRFNNLFNADVEVNKTAVHDKSLLGLKSPTLIFLGLIQNSRVF